MTPAPQPRELRQYGPPRLPTALDGFDHERKGVEAGFDLKLGVDVLGPPRVAAKSALRRVEVQEDFGANGQLMRIGRRRQVAPTVMLGGEMEMRLNSAKTQSHAIGLCERKPAGVLARPVFRGENVGNGQFRNRSGVTPDVGRVLAVAVVFERASAEPGGLGEGTVQNGLETDAGQIGLNVGMNVFDYVNPKGGSMQKALDYLTGFIGREKDWPYEQISGWQQAEDNLGTLVRKAAVVYKNEAYRDLWMQAFSKRLKGDWRLLVEPGPRP